jgi:membrane protein DedA with SNARE-associated domain
MPELLQHLEDLPGLIEAAVGRDPRLGYLALGLAMLLENLIPPIPSELIQPLGGLLVQQGRLALIPVILVGTTGTLLGAWFWYGVGRWVGEARLLALIQRHGGWLGIGAEELEASRRWFGRHGLALIFWGRLMPGVRTLISVPAGLEGMGQGPFLLATAAGSLIWVTALTLAGRALGAGYGQLIALAGPYALICQRLLLALALVGALALAWRAWRRRAAAGGP